MQGGTLNIDTDPVTRPYAHISLLEVVKRGIEARQRRDAEPDPLKRRVYDEHQYQKLQEEWRLRNAVQPVEGE